VCDFEEEEVLVRAEAGDPELAPEIRQGTTYPARTIVATALLGTAAGFLLARLIDRDA